MFLVRWGGEDERGVWFCWRVYLVVGFLDWGVEG